MDRLKRRLKCINDSIITVYNGKQCPEVLGPS